MSKIFLVFAGVSFILSILGGNPFFSIYLFDVEPHQYATFSIICLLFTIVFQLKNLEHR